jgi:DNA-binding transcriptional ArsR family regulator
MESKEKGRYEGIKSEFVKKKLAESSWSNKQDRKYIDELMTVERAITVGPKDFASSIFYKTLERKYKNEYKSILRELDPERYNKLIIEEQEREKRFYESLRKDEEEAKVRERLMHDSWVNEGGKE